MTGKIKSIKDQTLVVIPTNGGPDSTHVVADDAVVSLGNQPASLEELKKGDTVEIMGDPAISVAATRP